MAGMAVLIGGAIYVCCKLKGDTENELDSLMQNMQKKTCKMKRVCCCMKDQTKNIADEVKFAAQYSAEEMKDGWKNTEEVLKDAAQNIKDDVSEMKKDVMDMNSDDSGAQS
jgi:hypothetical protein